MFEYVELETEEQRFSFVLGEIGHGKWKQINRTGSTCITTQD
jgi:hypothetical protein